MTKKEFISKLEIISEMGDNQIKTLANLLIEWTEQKEKKDIGFKK